MSKDKSKVLRDKERRIRAIADFLFENPEAERRNVLSVFAKKWQVSTRTLDRYYADAQKISKMRILKMSKVRDEAIEAEAKKDALTGLRTRMEYFAELEKIAFGLSERKAGDQVIVPSDGDRVRALGILIKGLGYDYKSEILKKYI
jgi:hypothetical protein